MAHRSGWNWELGANVGPPESQDVKAGGIN